MQEKGDTASGTLMREGSTVGANISRGANFENMRAKMASERILEKGEVTKIVFGHISGAPPILTRQHLYTIIHKQEKHPVLEELLLSYLRPARLAFGELEEAAIERILRMHPHIFHVNNVVAEIQEHAAELSGLVNEVKAKMKRREKENALFLKYVRSDIEESWPIVSTD